MGKRMHENETILVVDDDLHIRTILGFKLEQEGFRVVQAADGPEALDKLELCEPDLVLLDVMMPGMDGFEVLHHLRGRFRTHNLPVIMLTAKGEVDEKVRGLSEGANDYVLKPFVPEELMLRVRNMLRLSRNQRDANPLTGLPGNRAIESELQKRIDAGDDFDFLYFDLDHFKSFNDFYGYARGDKMISLLAEILGRSVYETDGDTFLGHVGGDDFVAVTAPGRARALAESVIGDFDARVRFLYEPDDWNRGGVVVRDRTGHARRFPPVSLTVALVEERAGQLGHLGRLNALAAELKQFGKSRPGSTIVQERRELGVESGFAVTGIDQTDVK
jgi:PleD family two-component response regulator